MKKNNGKTRSYLNYLTGVLIEILGVLVISLAAYVIVSLIVGWYR